MRSEADSGKDLIERHQAVRAHGSGPTRSPGPGIQVALKALRKFAFGRESNSPVLAQGRGIRKMTIEEKDGVTIICIDDRLDAVVAPRFKDAIKKLVDENVTHVVVDLGKTRLIDSAGCGSLVGALRSLMRKGGQLKLARPSDQARTLLHLTRLHGIFDILDDVDEAVRSFNSVENALPPGD
jgi:anti-sigma B factor antagonist